MAHRLDDYGFLPKPSWCHPFLGWWCGMNLQRQQQTGRGLDRPRQHGHLLDGPTGFALTGRIVDERIMTHGVTLINPVQPPPGEGSETRALQRAGRASRIARPAAKDHFNRSAYASQRALALAAGT
jgi:hypothetical protein